MTFFDGTTWVPEKNMHSDMVRTEYRNRFNKPKPFHKLQLRYSMYMVPKKTLVYDKEDNISGGACPKNLFNRYTTKLASATKAN